MCWRRAQLALRRIRWRRRPCDARSFDRLTRVEPGFDPSDFSTVHHRLPRPATACSPPQRRSLSRPQWTASSFGVVRPGSDLSAALSAGDWFRPARPRSSAGPRGQDEGTRRRGRSPPAILRRVEIPLLAGRCVEPSDRAAVPGVAVISATAARDRYWPDPNPPATSRIHVSMGVREQVRESSASLATFHRGRSTSRSVPIIVDHVPAIPVRRRTR